MSERYGSRCRKDAFPAASGAAEPHAPTRHTECDGRLAVWRLDRGAIQILEVRDTAGAAVPLPARACTDLADMRERFPEYARLWDAIRHEFWAHTVARGLLG
ncbi:hypothetical protein AB0H42_24900 [Nocardia sp. NPDC050799]|uniref:hypothetical protein n=1 Tax=Nocardia sp. NPDC050799 TaxID=3154842 RepID=UPI0033E44255